MRDTLEASQRQFEPRASAYRESADHARAQDLARMLAWLQPRAGARALDLATGGGHTASALEAAGCRVCAVDATRSMLVALPATRLAALADAHALPFRDAAFDLVACRLAAHHFQDLAKALDESARVLRPGGLLYAFDLASPEDPAAAELVNRIERLRDPSHVWSRDAPAWCLAVQGAGLVLERVESGSSDVDFEAWLARAAPPSDRAEEVRNLLREHPPEALGGYGLTGPGRLRLLRVELLARKP